MHAEDLDYFEKDGDKWVRFDLDLKDVEQDKLVKSRIERKLQRELTVRGAGGKEDRPVVLMKVCVGDRLLEEEFSLRDRDEMNYPVLLGRRRWLLERQISVITHLEFSLSSLIK